MDILQKIVKDKEPEVQALKMEKSFKQWMEAARSSSSPRDFKKVLQKPKGVAVIAEIKKSSPSKGLLCPNFDPVKLAEIYHENGASAISVLTESKYFSGSRDFIMQIKENVPIPLLRKDFIFDSYQIPESRVLGADALLLIVAILTPGELSKFIGMTRDLKMTPLVEVHDEKELTLALEAGADLIGINNRNLRTFEVSLDTTCKLLEKIPEGVITVSESGIGERGIVKALEDARVDAILVGEHLVKSADPGMALKNLLGK